MTEPIDHDPDLEKCAIGACLLDPAVVPDVLALRRDDFYTLKHQKLIEAIGALDSRRVEIQLLTVRDELRERRTLDAVGGPLYIDECLAAVPSARGIHQIVAQLRRLGERRRTIDALKESTARITKAHLDDLEKETHRAIALLQGAAPPAATTVTSKTAVLSLLNDIDERATSGRTATISTCLWSLDEILRGMTPGAITLIAARPSTGKSSLMTTMAAALALKGQRVFYDSLEVSAQDVVLNMTAAHARVNSLLMRAGKLSEREMARVNDSAGLLASASLLIDDEERCTTAKLRAKIRRAMPLDIVFVDYLGLMEPPPATTREREVAMISRELKLLAKEFRVPIVVACQLNRAIEGRTDPVPKLSDLRDSGALEQDADQVVFLHNPNGVTTEPTIQIKFFVAKNRNGPIGMGTLNFTRPFNVFAPQDGPGPFQ